MRFLALILIGLSNVASAGVVISKHEAAPKMLVNSSYRGTNPMHSHASAYLNVFSDATGYGYRVKNTGTETATIKVFSQLSRIGDIAGCQTPYWFVYVNQQNGVVATELEREITLLPGEENKETGFLILSGRYKPGVYEHKVCAGEVCSTRNTQIVDTFACNEIADKELAAGSRGLVYGVPSAPTIYQNVLCVEQPAMYALPSAQAGKLILYWNTPSKDLGTNKVGAYLVYKWSHGANFSKGNSARLYAVTQENFISAEEGYYDIAFIDKAGTIHNVRLVTFLAKYENGIAKTSLYQANQNFLNPPLYCLDKTYLNKYRKPLPGY